MHPRSKRIGRVSRTGNTTASFGRACADPDGDALLYGATGAKNALRQTISLVDKMASKGIIHRNAAGRYKSRLQTRIAAKSKAA